MSWPVSRRCPGAPPRARVRYAFGFMIAGSHVMYVLYIRDPRSHVKGPAFIPEESEVSSYGFTEHYASSTVTCLTGSVAGVTLVSRPDPPLPGPVPASGIGGAGAGRAPRAGTPAPATRLGPHHTTAVLS